MFLDRTIAKYPWLSGAIIFVAAAQWIVSVEIAEALYPNYSISQNFLSDLGATCPSTLRGPGLSVASCVFQQPSATIFDLTLFIVGLLSLLSAYLTYLVRKDRPFTIVFSLYGTGVLGAGLFPENYGQGHLLISIVAFFFGPVSAIITYRLVKSPFKFLAGILGIIALASFLGSAVVPPSVAYNSALGVGGLERMVAYPILLWEIGLGSYLIGSPLRV